MRNVYCAYTISLYYLLIINYYYYYTIEYGIHFFITIIMFLSINETVN